MTSMILNAHPYTQSQFSGLATKQFGGAYPRYLSWWNQNVAPKFAARAGYTPPNVDTTGAQIPGALMTPEQLITMGKQMYPIMSANDALKTARNAVSTQYDPIISKIQQTVQGQTDQGRAAIQQLTDRYAQRVGNIDNELGGIYSQARQQQLGVNDALASYIKGQGGSLAAGLNADNPINLAAMGGAAGGAQLATGSAAMDNLIGQGAAEQAFGAKLPAYARSFGLQAAAGFESQQGNTLQTALDQIASQSQQGVTSLYGDLLNRNQQARQGRADLLNNGLTRAAQLAATTIGANVDVAGLNQSGAQFWTNPANYTLPPSYTNPPAAPAGSITPQNIAGFLQGAYNNTLKDVLPVDPNVGSGTPRDQIIGRIPRGGGARGDPYGSLYPSVLAYMQSQLAGVPGITQKQIAAQADRALRARGITPITPRPPAYLSPDRRGTPP